MNASKCKTISDSPVLLDHVKSQCWPYLNGAIFREQSILQEPCGNTWNTTSTYSAELKIGLRERKFLE